MLKRLLLTLLLLIAASPLRAAEVPSPSQFLGYTIGDRFTPHHRVLGYLHELEQKSNLITIHQFGETYEGRPLVYALITSAKNRANLEAIRQATASINRPDTTSPARAQEIAASTPVVVWLAFGVHGNESSSTEAAMIVAHRLAAGGADAADILERCIVIIDPLENPDGRDRYVEWFHRSIGSSPDSNRDGFEHFEPWPGGRYNHYLSDMNRDWAWASQRETAARIRAYQQWNPQVFVDFHEMSYESSYFFPPDAHPINANIDPEAEKWLEKFGVENAAAFSSRKWPFFVAETFDLFYPGYGDSWPSLRGAIGMTYEMAGGGRAGTVIKKEDGTLLRLSDRAEKHATTAMTTLTTAAANRAELVLHSYQSLRNQFEKAKTTYVIPKDSPNFERALELLDLHGVEIHTLETSQRLKVTSVDDETTVTRDFVAGSAVIPTRQPLAALIHTFLERTPALAKEFVEEQRKLMEVDQPDEFYDITSWSLPVSHNLAAFLTSTTVGDVERWKPKISSSSLGEGKIGYLIPGSDENVYRAAGRFLASQINFNVASVPITVGTIAHPAGSLLILRHNNGEKLDEAMRAIAGRMRIEIVPIETGWSGGRVAVGSSKIQFVRDPKIAILGGEGTYATSFGTLWHTFDIDSGIPHTVLPVSRVGSTDLSQFRVLIIPDGTRYAERMGKSGVERLQAWVRGGGVLIAIKEASAFLRDKEVALSKIELWEPPKKKEGEEKATDERYNEYRIPGAAFRTDINGRSHLTFGLSKPPYVLMEGSTFFKKVAKRVDNVITIREKDALISGFAWPESLEQIKGTAYLVSERAGSGTVITFADEPNYRMFWRGTLPLLLNAALYTPSF